MPRACSICVHPKYLDVTADLISRVPYRTLQRRYGVSKSSVERHMAHARTELRAFIEREASHGDAAVVVPVLVEMRKLNTRALRILQQAEDAKDRSVALHAIRECRRNLELIAKLTGELDPRAAGEVPGTPLTVVVQYVDKAVMLNPTEAQRLNGGRPAASGGHSTETAGNVLPVPAEAS